MSHNTKIFISSVAVLIILWFFFVHTYTSSPGFTTQEYAENFYNTSPKCMGISFLLNGAAVAADAPGKSLCIGVLVTPEAALK